MYWRVSRVVSIALLATVLLNGKAQAANWGRPNEDSFGPDLDDPYTFEMYYRLQITEQFALTSDIQYLADPAQDSLGIFGLRARLAL